MTLRNSSLAAIASLALFVGACKEDPPTGNTLDPTMPTNPCDSGYARVVGTNGFIMSGSGFQGQVVAFTDFERSVQTDYYGIDDAAITFSIIDTVAIKGDPTTRVFVEMHIPNYRPNTYEFNNILGDSAAYVRVELRQDGLNTKVYKSVAGQGRIILDSFVNGAEAVGRYCGVMQDSTSRSQIGIMNGKFDVTE